MACMKLHGQTGRHLKTRFQEHTRYIKSNKNEIDYWAHILFNRHLWKYAGYPETKLQMQIMYG
jgi:hypothetical protein